ncbi:reverse transcriptase N-terminal domain-containing protein [Pseudoxanthomonas mexicana]
MTKATQGGKWRRVKSLQRMLSRSFCGKAMAVRRVTENQGARTAGVDRELWSTPEAKLDAINQLERRGYKPRPLRRVYIPKSNGKKPPGGPDDDGSGHASAVSVGIGASGGSAG